MTQNPMVAEVNRLLANLFAAGESVAFPSVGTLLPVKRPARRLSKRQVIPPLHEIDFKSDLVGQTLAERLAAAAHCPIEQAEEIYGRWLGHTFKEGVLTLEGVGVLQHKHFQLDPAFDQRLNPQGRAPLAVRARRRGWDWTIWLGLTAAVAAVAIGLYGYNELKGTVQMPWQQESTTTVVASEIPAMAEKEAAPAEEPVAPSTVETDTKSAAEVVPTAAPTRPMATPAPAPAPRKEGVQTMQSGHFYVVLGVFSTEENAERAVKQALNEGFSETMIYYFGQKYMVSPCTAADTATCAAFRQQHAAKFPDLWVYKAR